MVQNDRLELDATGAGWILETHDSTNVCHVCADKVFPPFFRCLYGKRNLCKRCAFDEKRCPYELKQEPHHHHSIVKVVEHEEEAN